MASSRLVGRRFIFAQRSPNVGLNDAESRFVSADVSQSKATKWSASSPTTFFQTQNLLDSISPNPKVKVLQQAQSKQREQTRLQHLVYFTPAVFAFKVTVWHIRSFISSTSRQLKYSSRNKRCLLFKNKKRIVSCQVTPK